MSTRILGPTGSKRRKRFLLVPTLLVALAAFFVIAGAQANPPEQAGFFELDKNVINNEQTPSFSTGSPPVQKTLGSLGGNINASVTSFTVCQNVETNPTTSVANPITIQIDAERMTVGTIANASGGGCTGAFKRTYSNVTRGVLNTTAASHGASGVSGYVTQVTFNTVAGDDWDQVRAAVQLNGSPSATNPNPCSGTNWTGNTAARACDFIHDEPGKSVFTTGGSKDDLDINVGTAPNITHNWMWTDSSVPDSDDITDGYAIKYQASAPGSHQFLYFGADRVAVNGAKDMGFWFFKSPVSQNPDGTFSGQHTFGDILLLSTFTNGGATTTIRIFKWVGPNNGADTNGVLLSGGNFGDCVPGGSSDGCSTVNNGTIKSPWDYQSKISGTPAKTIYAGGAMEGGVDLTSLNLTGCFSSFLAETRSAPEVGAQLKDFLLGTFESCGSSLTTTPKDGSGNAIPNDGLSIGSGIVSAKDSADLQVTGTDTWSGTLKFFLCGPIPIGDTCNGTTHVGLQIGNTVNLNVTQANPFSGPIVSAAARITSAANNTTGAPGHYCWRGVFTSSTQGVDNQTDATQGECFLVKPVTPTIVTTAVEAGPAGLSPTIYGGFADLNGSGTVTGADDSTDFYGDTDIIDGGLDCNNWGATENAGTNGDGVIDTSDDCTMVGYDGTANGVTIGVVDGKFATADGVAIANGTPLPKVFPDPNTPNDPSVVNAKFAWSTIFGKVDSNGNGVIDGDDCANGVVGNAGILGDTACGSPVEGFNGKVDLNADGTITSADACTNKCFLGHDVAHGLVVAGTVPFGQAVYDAATLTGTATQPGTNGPLSEFPSIYQASDPPIPNGANAAGTIEFTLLGPGDCSTVAAKKTGTTGSNPETVTVNGNGDYKTSGFTTASPGVFHWKAVYSGNNPNTLGTDHNTGCTDAGEDVTVQQIPTDVKTKQSWFPNDHATITSTIAGTTLQAGGHVDFTLYDTATCSGNILYTERQDLAGGNQSEEVFTHNDPGSTALTPGGVTVTPYRESTGYGDAADTTTAGRSWKVVYTPLVGDTAHTGSSSECTAGHTEKHTYTYTNDPGH